MDVMALRRNLLMQQQPAPEQWDLIWTVYLDGNLRQTTLFDVTAGQTLYVEWDGAPAGATPNTSGWVLNGNGCCTDIKRLSDNDVGATGSRTLSVTASGQVRVAGYSTTNNFILVEGSTVKIRVL